MVQATRFSRVCLEDAMQHAQRRTTFGKKLIESGLMGFCEKTRMMDQGEEEGCGGSDDEEDDNG